MRAWVVLISVAGCASDPIALDDYIAARAHARCAYLVRCGAVESVDDCLYNLPARAFEHGCIADESTYDGTVARACIDAYASLSCDISKWSPDDLEPCLALELERPGGQLCALDVECKSHRCGPGGIATRGWNPLPSRCDDDYRDPANRFPEGALCNVSADCVDSAYCAMDRTCRTRLARGASCGDAPDGCARGLYCVDAFVDGATPECRRRPRIGEPCNFDICADVGAFCHEGTCTRGLTIGESCHPDRYGCSRFYQCKYYETGTCERLPGPGEHCFYARCVDAWCAAGEPPRCIPTSAIGDYCTADAHCGTHQCVSGVCQEPTCVMSAP